MEDLRDQDHYAVLGVAPTSSAREIQAAFYKMSRKVHPDKNKSPTATADFQKLQRAFETLSDPELRKKFDDERQRRAKERQRDRRPEQPQPEPEPEPHQTEEERNRAKQEETDRLCAQFCHSVRQAEQKLREALQCLRDGGIQMGIVLSCAERIAEDPELVSKMPGGVDVQSVLKYLSVLQSDFARLDQKLDDLVIMVAQLK